MTDAYRPAAANAQEFLIRPRGPLDVTTIEEAQAYVSDFRGGIEADLPLSSLALTDFITRRDLDDQLFLASPYQHPEYSQRERSKARRGTALIVAAMGVLGEVSDLDRTSDRYVNHIAELLRNPNGQTVTSRAAIRRTAA